jgi:putative ABC transport system permease protein
MQDLKLALKSLIASPGYVAIAVLSLAFGLGGATAVFSLVDAILLRELPLPNGDRVFAIQEFQRGQSTGGNPGRLPDLAAAKGVEFGAGYYSESALLDVDGRQKKVGAIRYLGDFHQVIGVPLAAGRMPTKSEGLGQGKRVAVVSSRLASQMFQNGEVLGKMIRIEKEAFEVIGVFDNPLSVMDDYDLWTNAPESMWSGMGRTARFMTQIVRLKSGVSVEQLTAEWDVINDQLARQHPESDRDMKSTLIPILEAETKEARRPLLLVWGVMLTVFLIACVNIAGLTLARSLSRAREAAIRSVLGATTFDLMKRFFSETLVVVLLGTISGLASAYGLLHMLKTVLPSNTPRLMEASIDLRTLGFALMAASVAAIVSGLLPIWQAVKDTSSSSLRGASTGAIQGGGSLPVRSFLVTIQIALSTALLVLAGLTTYAFMQVRTGNLGFVAQGRMVFGVDFSWGSDPGVMRAFVQKVTETLKSRPGVLEVGMVDRLPLGGGSASTRIAVQGKTMSPEVKDTSFGWRAATPEFAKALGTRLLKGRLFTTAPGVNEVVVTQSFAKQVFGDEDPIGQYVGSRFGEKMPDAKSYQRIVGVIENIQQKSSALTAEPEVFNAWQKSYWPMLHFVVHAPGQEAALIREIRSIVKTIDPQQEVTRIETLQDHIEDETGESKTTIVLIGSFALLALILSCIGLYGLLEAEGVKRQREVGIRLALGATPARVRTEALWRGLRFTGVGMAIGLIITALVARIAEQMLPGLPFREAAPYLMAIGCLLPVCIVACWVPALRAGQVDPMLAIRNS